MRRSPNYWFTKIEQDGVGMRITYKTEEDSSGKKKAEVNIWYHTDDIDQGEAPISIMNKIPERKGLVGFSWRDTKFSVKSLKVTGKLDKEAAVAFLREKLGIPRSGKTTETESGGGSKDDKDDY